MATCIKPGGGGGCICLHVFAQVLCQKIEEPLTVIVSGEGTEGLGAGWEENFTFYCLNYFQSSACINSPQIGLAD